ncbi:MAG: DNA alkylation repair protein [Candidatus Thorarchaeota archaeon]|jgi:3-methyladenine DNA glycosylase AlkD
MDDLRSRKDEEKGKMVASYMKGSSLQFLGVSVTEARKITKRHIKGLAVDVLPMLIDELWNEPVFDFKLAAIEALEKYSAKGDIQTAFSMIDRMIEDVDTWSTVDPLCIVCLGNVIIRDAAYESKIARWRKSSNLAALVPHLTDTQFFVAKAVGWVLRGLSKLEPKTVHEFIDRNRESMAKLSIREGSKYL